jgi:two-component system phosphate regulon sensor histidine kinase PhoR
MDLDTPALAFHDTDEKVYLRGALDSAGAIIYTIDRSFRIMTVNAAWDQFAIANEGAHLRGSAVVGTNLLDWIRGPHRDQTQQVCEAIFAGKLPRYESDFDCSSPQQRRICALVVTPLCNPDGAIIGASFVCHDVTRRKLLEEEVQARNDELRELVAVLRRQHSATEQERDRAQALGRVIATLNVSLSAQSTVDTLLAVATQLVHVPAGAVYLLSEGGGRLVPWGSCGLDLEHTDPRAFERATSAAGQVIAQQAPGEIPDCSATDGIFYPRLADGSLPGSLYVTPISTYDGAIGALAVYSPEHRAFDDGEQWVLNALAASAGIAIANARIYDEQVQGRKRAEELAQLAAEHTAQLSATIGAMSDGVWMCDQTGRIITVNDAALKIFPLCREKLIGHSIEILSDLICRGDRPHLGLRAALHGETVHVECTIQVRDVSDELVVDICATPIQNADGTIKGAVTVVRDITRAKAMDRIKEDFLSIAAHELKTPITALKGYTQLTLRRIGDLPELGGARRYLHTIDEQADRIGGLVQKLLDVSRIHTGKLDLQWSEFDLHKLVTATAERVRLISPSHTVALDGAPVMVVADMQRIEQVIYNLLENAAKYSPDGGVIRVELETSATRALVTVSDQGLGIPAEKLPYIFDRWYQAHDGTHGDFGGMGLGLYICKEIVERHGGYMWARSDEQGGSTIGFAIPLRPPQPASLEQAEPRP